MDSVDLCAWLSFPFSTRGKMKKRSTSSAFLYRSKCLAVVGPIQARVSASAIGIIIIFQKQRRWRGVSLRTQCDRSSNCGHFVRILGKSLLVQDEPREVAPARQLVRQAGLHVPIQPPCGCVLRDDATFWLRRSAHRADK